jgi:hypothetical protein
MACDEEENWRDTADRRCAASLVVCEYTTLLSDCELVGDIANLNMFIEELSG